GCYSDNLRTFSLISTNLLHGSYERISLSYCDTYGEPPASVPVPDGLKLRATERIEGSEERRARGTGWKGAVRAWRRWKSGKGAGRAVVLVDAVSRAWSSQ